MEYQVKQFVRQNFAPTHFTIEGADLLDAIKRNFYLILERSSREFIPFRYPMTVKPVYVQTVPDSAKLFKNGPDGKPVEDTTSNRGHIEFRLEWMYSEYDNKPGTLKTHTIYVEGKPEDLTDTTPFVMEGK